MNKEKIKPIIIISLILLCGLGLFLFLYSQIDVVYNKPINNSSNSDYENLISSYEIKTDKTTYTCLFDEDYLDYKSYLNIELPVINSEKENAKKLNDSIKKDFETFYTNTTGERAINRMVDIKYNYLIKNDYLYITVKGHGLYGCSFEGPSKIKFYYYDIKSDKILNSKKAFEAAKYTLNDKKTYDNKDVTYDLCDKKNNEGLCGCGIEVKDNELKVYFVDRCM